MTSSKTLTGLAAATALAALAGASFSAPAFAQDSGKQVACYGVNSCKGLSDCKSGAHDCKGMNDCKGQGFKDMTAKACAAAGGSLTAPKK